MGFNPGVYAEADDDASLQRVAKHITGTRYGDAGLGFDSGREVDTVFQLVIDPPGSHQRRDRNGSALLHRAKGFIVQERAVFNGIDACADGPFGTGRAVGMGRGLASQGVGLVYQGVEFRLGQLRGVDVVG